MRRGLEDGTRLHRSVITVSCRHLEYADNNTIKTADTIRSKFYFFMTVATRNLPPLPKWKRV